MFTEDEIKDGAESPTLGPAYFASRKVAERFMSDFEAEHFKPLIEEFSKQLQAKLWEDIEGWLIADTENNLQSKMWHHTDDMVKHILAGDEWAMKKFVLGERYDCERVREAVAKHIPQELQDARIKDLEAEIEKLKKDVAFYQRSH